MKTFLFSKLALIGSILISPAYSSDFHKNASVSFYDEISKESDDGQVLISTPYFLQGQNKYEPGATCGLTSAAMLLGYWSSQLQSEIKSPDELYETYGKRQGQSPDTLRNLYIDQGYMADHTYSGTRQDIKDQLDKGRPVVIHGWFTRNGHIILIVGYNEEGFIVNDPAGNWQRCYRCGYGSGQTGNERIYTYEQMSDKVIGVDGDIWMSYAYPE